MVQYLFFIIFSVSLGQMAIATDKMFRVLYPIVYLIFVCCYFLNYIHWMKTSSQFLLKYQTKCITSDSKKWRTCLFGVFNVRMRKKKMKEKVSREWKMIFGCYLVHISIQHQNSSKNGSIFFPYIIVTKFHGIEVCFTFIPLYFLKVKYRNLRFLCPEQKICYWNLNFLFDLKYEAWISIICCY